MQKKTKEIYSFEISLALAYAGSLVFMSMLVSHVSLRFIVLPLVFPYFHVAGENLALRNIMQVVQSTSNFLFV